MYEINQGTTAARREPIPPRETYSPAGDIAAASFLFWGEHCIECAAPACYQTCDLYRSRPDGHCRRFVSGVVRNAAFSSARGYGAEVTFKKWGKLETRGNTTLISHGSLLLLERLLGWSASVLDRLGAVVSPVTGDERWRSLVRPLLERLARKLHARRRGAPPDAFLLEVFNPEGAPTILHVSMTVARRELPAHARRPTASFPSYLKQIELPPGYSRNEIPHSEFAAVTESGLPFDLALIPETESEPTLIFLSADFVRFARQPIALAQVKTDDRPAIKCVVWDLDNTLWNGILLEDEQVNPNEEALQLVRALDQRGILSSAVSKNDFDLALAKMKEIGIEEFILFPQIGWTPKSEGIKIIAEKLNIGLDTFLFVDDSQFELDEVARALPMVSCVNTREIASLATDPRLQGGATVEARRRRLMYREAMTREQEEHKFGADFFGFLRSCDIKLRLIPYKPQYFERICELLQRTNQLNFSGRKYKREEIYPILEEERLEKLVLECSDKFGSYGIVGFSLVERRAGEVWIEDFMLSCRVQGRFVELAFFRALVEDDPTIERVTVNFRPTGRNTPAQQVLSTIGFQEASEGAGMKFDLRKQELSCDFIEVEREPPIRAVSDQVA